MRLDVTPDIFGSNTFTVAVKDGARAAVAGATVIMTLTSTDMDMGTEKPHAPAGAGQAG